MPRLAVPAVGIRSVGTRLAAGTQNVGETITRSTAAVGFRLWQSPLLALAVAAALGLVVGVLARRLAVARARRR